MRVFVVGTGRSGTSTAYHALQHVAKHTVGHESRAGILLHHEYPENHIEVSSQLIPEIVQLALQYPNAKWIWLKRGKSATVRSIATQCPDAMAAYGFQWFQVVVKKEEPRRSEQLLQIAELYYDAMYSLLSSLLPTDAYCLHIETIKDQWEACWKYHAWEGDFQASLSAWNRHYNAHDARGRDNYSGAEE